MHKIVRHSTKDDRGIRTVRFLSFKLRITPLNNVRNPTNYAVMAFVHALNSNRGLRSSFGILHIHNMGVGSNFGHFAS